MQLVHTDAVFRLSPGAQPDYESDNPMLRLMGVVQSARFAAERELYLPDDLQYLVPIDHFELYSPSVPDNDVVDARLQDTKTDFQKQNVRTFRVADTVLIRGAVKVGPWSTPFLQISYRGGPDSALSRTTNHALGDRVALWIKVGDRAAVEPIVVPYHAASRRYTVEIWGHVPGDVRPYLGKIGRESLDSGRLIVRPDLVQGGLDDFRYENVKEKVVRQLAPAHLLHPIRPVAVELAWSNTGGQVWDNNGGGNYRYEFSMIVRGRDAFLAGGVSSNPHGGIGALDYRNLLSNYFGHGQTGELARALEPWNFDASGNKGAGGRVERFMALDYMDLHCLHGNGGIGLHRHRDNQEIFLVLSGRGFMVVGDWCKMPGRERALEVRTLRSGHLAMLKGGQVHGLLNATDETMELFMFGGYD